MLIAAKALCESEDPEDLAATCPAVARIGAVRGKDACRVLEACREEIEALRSSLAE